MRYRKKPVEVEAMRVTWGSSVTDVINFVGVANFLAEGNDFYIKTLEGNMRISVGDFIIRGVNGEYYPCKPDVFEKTYEKVEEVSE